jgi:hypothetical protein
MVSSTFEDFLASAKEASCEEFYASRIAKENCIEPSWFIKYQPVCFTVLDDEQWFVKFSIDGKTVYWTMIEKDEHWGSLELLAKDVFSWLQEEYGE